MPPFLFFCTEFCSVSAEKHRNAPQAGKTYKGINDPAEQRILASKQPCYKVELENADKAPVEGADDG